VETPATWQANAYDLFAVLIASNAPRLVSLACYMIGMPRHLHIQVTTETITVSGGEKGEQRIPNIVALDESPARAKILAVGIPLAELQANGAAAAARDPRLARQVEEDLSRVRMVRGLDAEAASSGRAAAVVAYLIAAARHDPRSSFLRLLFRSARETVTLQWPEWDAVGASAQALFNKQIRPWVKDIQIDR
jgi:hypothetical protein